jgi:non-specific serine/threonine protein kinase
LAGALGALRQPEQAARLFGVADARFEAISAAVWPTNAADFARGLARVHAQLDEQRYAAAYAAGRALSQDKALAEVGALGESIDAEPLEEALIARSSSGADGLALTPREREVAALVAQGLTNRQIGAALVITEGTARLHVKHILHKLGFSSRAQIAAWAVAHRLATIPS